MFDSLTADVSELLQMYGALGVFLGSIIEEIIAPIPSTAVVLLGGFLLIPRDASFLEVVSATALKVMLPASIGISVGSLFPYYVARIGGKVAIDRFSKLLGVDWALVEKAQKYFENSKRDELLLFLVRAVPIIPSVIIGVFCGLVRIPVKEFLIWSFLGSLVRTFILGLIGWAAGSAYSQYAEQISGVENIVLVLSVLVMIGFCLWLRRSKKY